MIGKIIWIIFWIFSTYLVILAWIGSDWSTRMLLSILLLFWFGGPLYYLSRLMIAKATDDKAYLNKLEAEKFERELYKSLDSRKDDNMPDHGGGWNDQP